MRIFFGFDDLPRFRRPVVTVGSYDGVHCGHRQLLSRIVEIASSTGGESVVVTFSPHPRRVLEGCADSAPPLNDPPGRPSHTFEYAPPVNRDDRPNPKHSAHSDVIGPPMAPAASPPAAPLRELNSVAEKAMLLEQVGIDNLIVAPFTGKFSRITSYDFVKRFLIEKIGVRVLVVGYNHHFGHNKEGDFGFLRRLQGEFDFEVYEVPRHEVDEQKVSSTVVRELIGRGEMAAAARILGQPYFALLHRVALPEATAGMPAPRWRGLVVRAPLACRGTDCKSAPADTAAGMLYPDSPDKLLPPAGEYKVGVAAWNERAAAPATRTLTIAPGGELRLDPAPPCASAPTDLIVTFL